MKKKYLNVNNRLGQAIIWNQRFKTLVGINIGAIFTQDNFWTKLVIFLFGAVCLLGLNETAKIIDLNTPSKKQIGDLKDIKQQDNVTT